MHAVLVSVLSLESAFTMILRREINRDLLLYKVSLYVRGLLSVAFFLFTLRPP